MSSSAKPTTTVQVGIDVSKHGLDVCILSANASGEGETLTVNKDPASIGALPDRIRQLPVYLDFDNPREDEQSNPNAVLKKRRGARQETLLRYGADINEEDTLLMEPARKKLGRERARDTPGSRAS